MPVRIYDISKKLGLESKEVLSKAKELGITAARVASSSLDKITAEYLEEQLSVGRPAPSTSEAAATDVLHHSPSPDTLPAQPVIELIKESVPPVAEEAEVEPEVLPE